MGAGSPVPTKPVRVSRQRRMLLRSTDPARRAAAVDECQLDVCEPLLVVAGEVEAEVVVVEGRQLEVRELLRARDRRGDAEHLLEVVRPPADREQQPVRAPRIRPLERPQRRLERPYVVRARLAEEVEEEQAVEARRDRVAVRVLCERLDPGVLARRQAGRLRAERDRRLAAAGQRTSRRYAPPPITPAAAARKRRRVRVLRMTVRSGLRNPAEGHVHPVRREPEALVLEVPRSRGRADEQSQVVEAGARQRDVVAVVRPHVARDHRP